MVVLKAQESVVMMVKMTANDLVYLRVGLMARVLLGLQ